MLHLHHRTGRRRPSVAPADIRHPGKATAAALAACLAAVLAGCATTPTAPEEVVKERATQYWQARIAGKPAQAYALLTPAYRSVRTLEQYTLQYGSPGGITAAEVASVQCEPEKCTARVKLTTKVPLPMLNMDKISTYVDETWLLDGGTWWRYLEP